MALLLGALSCSSSHKTAASPSSGVIGGSPSRQESEPVAKTGSDNRHSKPRLDPLQEKYAPFLNVQPEEIQNLRLYHFIDNWLYTPYKWGGTNKEGIDCSAFMQLLLKEVYNISIPRTSITQFFDQWVDLFDSKRYLSEGDLVFFRTMEDKVVSHVGLYLGNRKFVNASSSKGVIIANLDDPYWKTKFVAAGRVKESLRNR